MWTCRKVTPTVLERIQTLPGMLISVWNREFPLQLILGETTASSYQASAELPFSSPSGKRAVGYLHPDNANLLIPLEPYKIIYCIVLARAVTHMEAHVLPEDLLSIMYIEWVDGIAERCRATRGRSNACFWTGGRYGPRTGSQTRLGGLKSPKIYHHGAKGSQLLLTLTSGCSL